MHERLESLLSNVLKNTGEIRVSNNNFRAIRQEEEYFIYSLSTLTDLLTAMQEQEEEPTIRYLVDVAGKLWFAREHHDEGPNFPSPAHYKMTGEQGTAARCIAAGNITFAADYNTIHAINHRSGDFQPSFHSILWPIAILLAQAVLPIVLPEVLILNELNSSGGFLADHRCSLERLREWMETFVAPEILEKITHQPTITKLVSYSPPYYSPVFAGKTARTLFPDAQDPNSSPPCKRLFF